MKTFPKFLGLIALAPTLSFAQFVDFGARSQAAEPSGFTLLDVAPDTPAAALGLQPGDVVTKLEGRTLTPATSLARVIATLYSKGDELNLNWSRNGEALSGKIILDRVISKSAFNSRYDESPKLSADLPVESLIDELHKNNPNPAAMASVMKLSIGTNGAGMVMQSTTNTPDGDSIRVSSSGGETKDVKITDKAGELVYEGTITEANLDEVPEKYRDAIRNMFGNSPRIMINPSTTFGTPPATDAPEEDINDLLHNLESQQGE